MEKEINQRARWVFKMLQRTYPDARCELDFKTPLELLVATVLSAQCTDKRVNLVTRDLFRKYRSAADFASAPRRELEQDIRSTGFFRSKALSIQGAARKILEDFGGRVPDTLEQLTQLPGIGRKTANVILGAAFHRAEGIAVDTHVIRITRLIGLTREKLPEKIEQDLMRLFPKRDWILLSHLITFHGRRCCIARRPECFRCPLRSRCPSAETGSKKGGR
jgi:endonuclease-3